MPYNKYLNFPAATVDFGNKCCDKICNIKTIATEVVDGTLYLLLKKRFFTNGERFGLIICNNICFNSGDEPVEISVGIGPAAESFPLLDTFGNPVLARTLKTRCRIPITVSTSESAFLVSPKYLCNPGTVLGGAAEAEEGGN